MALKRINKFLRGTGEKVADKFRLERFAGAPRKLTESKARDNLRKAQERERRKREGRKSTVTSFKGEIEDRDRTVSTRIAELDRDARISSTGSRTRRRARSQ